MDERVRGVTKPKGAMAELFVRSPVNPVQAPADWLCPVNAVFNPGAVVVGAVSAVASSCFTGHILRFRATRISGFRTRTTSGRGRGTRPWSAFVRARGGTRTGSAWVHRHWRSHAVGWGVYHGVKNLVGGSVHRAGFVWLDLDEPAYVVARSVEWALAPMGDRGQRVLVAGSLGP